MLKRRWRVIDAALGVTHFVFDPAPQDLRGGLAMMERFAEDVRPKVLRAPR